MVLMTKKILIAVGSIVGVTIPTALAITYTKDASGSSNEKNKEIDKLLEGYLPKIVATNNAKSKTAFELTARDFSIKEIDKIENKNVHFEIIKVEAFGRSQSKNTNEDSSDEVDGTKAIITIKASLNEENKKIYTIKMKGFKTPKQAWNIYVSNHQNWPSNFKGCLDKITWTPNSKVEGSISNYAFQGLTIPSDFKIPYGITSIGDGAFKGATIQSDFHIPSSVTSIHKEAFANITLGNYQFTIPDRVTTIEEGAFSGIKSLPESFKWPSETSTILSNVFKGTTLPHNFVIPDTVKIIKTGAFEGATFFTDIQTFIVAGNHNGVTIERYAFKGTQYLKQVEQ